jgi:hypothetical protein
MPLESDSDEDWYDRRKRIDAIDRMEEQDRMRPPIQHPLQLARSQAFAMAGVPPLDPRGGQLLVDMDGDIDKPYRPAPPGKSVHLPMTGRTLYRPAELDDYAQMGYAPPQRLLQRRDQLADRLVGEALQPGLGRYMDPQVIEGKPPICRPAKLVLF